MTKREAAIVSAYTGWLLGDHDTFHSYVEEKFGRTVFTHEMASKEFEDKLRTLSRDDFLNLEVK